MDKLEIRKMAATDLTACIQIFARAWADAFPQHQRHINEAVFHEETADEVIFVAFFGPRIVGFAALYLPEDFLHHLYIEPTLYRHGIGRALVATCQNYLNRPCALKVQISNTNARAFYTELGFVEAEHGTDDYGPWIGLVAQGN